MRSLVQKACTVVALVLLFSPADAHAFGRLNPVRWFKNKVSPPKSPVALPYTAVPTRLPSTLREPAIRIEDELFQRHLYPSVVDPEFVTQNLEETQIERYLHAGDSAIWTGHALAALSYRYAVEKDPAELDRIKTLLGAIETLIEVSPGHDQLTRYAIPVDDPMGQPDGPILGPESGNGIYRGTAHGREYYFLGRTSRDQYAGVFLGLSVAYEVVDDADVRLRCQDMVFRMLSYLNANNWEWDMDESLAVVPPAKDTTITFHSQPLHKAGMLAVGRQISLGAFGKQFNENRPALLANIVLSLETWDDYKSYYKYNLDYIHFFALVRLEFVDTWRREFFNKYVKLRSTVLGTGSGYPKNALFNLYDLVITGAAPWSSCGGKGTLCPAYDIARESSTVGMLEEWTTRTRRNIHVDRSNEVRTCRPPFEWLPFYETSADRMACEPLPVPLRITTDFLWQRSPQQLVSWGDGRVEYAGIDLLLPYWMARYYSVLVD